MGHLILVGFMGAGKTRIGEALSEMMSLPFVDTDCRVEERNGMSVADIFRERGEEYFRDEEGEVIRGLSGEGPSVVSCGGGAVLRPGNLEALRGLGEVFYLKVGAGEAAKRLERDTSRPLLAGEDGRRERIEALLEQREPAYLLAADHVVESGNRSVDEIVEEIERLWRGSR